MSATTKASQEYLRNAVMTASPEQLQLMLFDGAIKFTRVGIEGLENEDFEQAFNGFERTQRIVLQMINGLNRDINPDLVDQMRSLYHYIYRCVIEAGLHRDIAQAEDALRILQHQRETWSLLLKKLAAERSSTAPQPRAGSDEYPKLSIEG